MVILDTVMVDAQAWRLGSGSSRSVEKSGGTSGDASSHPRYLQQAWPIMSGRSQRSPLCLTNVQIDRLGGYLGHDPRWADAPGHI
jgi:hypothetical protein